MKKCRLSFPKGGLAIRIKGIDACISKDNKYNIYARLPTQDGEPKEVVKADKRIVLAREIASMSSGSLDFVRDAFFNKKTVRLEVKTDGKGNLTATAIAIKA